MLDAHHHLWDPRLRPYPWMVGPAARLRTPQLLAELRAVTEPAGVTATVAVQAAHSEEETTWLLGLADESGGLVAGVVGWTDLEAPDAADRVAALREAPGGERLVGIRHQAHDEPDPEWLDGDAVRRGLRAVAAAGLTYDLLLFPEHLAPARRVAEAIPELPLVVDHGSKPRIAGGAWEPWSSDLAALAAHPHVHCKLSGLVTEARHSAWREDGVERYAQRLLELFGPERLMFGSDWPVCTLAASYAEVLEVATSILGPSDRDVMGPTAERFYGLAASASAVRTRQPW